MRVLPRLEVNLRRSATVLYAHLLPDLRGYEKARKVALNKLENRDGVPILKREPDIYPVFLIYGSALENAFKGAMIHQDKSLISAKRLSKKLKDHNLPRLAKCADIPLSAREQQVLTWVSEVVIWKGRYSVPTELTKSVFYHPLDNVSLENARNCMSVLNDVFGRVMSQLPARKRLFRWGAMVRVDSTD